ncbi:squalene synthase HpnC [Bordetella avium]|uniref:Phytoene synthase n=1 Tax=Bordetella avium (strain 197N) TaxID=360910 RepID=Q2KXU6_BORA1|nr:squalene synthase HpnC [Bordetella avium]AZY49797.1 squalene synthase HpnC [Bordetella avium]AZY54360.1 squalene synthase HpnC [Bordetella avium]RIQ12609.1 squalene synthase HpnC [Bordetella avium]RIQ17778.1 squalene synthase HpnC [Bordetella avium]RIQ32435.1 squalene synthase HpnC [Bordetella avium]
MAVDHYENFPVASVLLPRRLRPAVRDIYRYARSADDIADEGEASPSERVAELERFRAELHHLGAGLPGDPALAPIFEPLAATIRQHQLPITPFFDLLSAFEQDVGTLRYADFLSLRDYCSRSADPVGRLMLHLYQAATPENIRDADAICTGLQLTNFWQDVQVDWRKGRVYLPEEDLIRFGVSEEDLAACRLTPAWRALMAFEIDRTRALLHSGAALPRRLPGRIGLELRLVIQGGLRILQRIEQADYDVFMNRPQLGARDWAILAWRALTSR